MSQDLATFETVPAPADNEQPTVESQPNPAVQQSSTDAVPQPSGPGAEGTGAIAEPQTAGTSEGIEVNEPPALPPESEPQQAAAQKAGMDDVFADEYAYQRPKRGEIREGHIIAIREDSIVVDLGLKREGIVPPDDMERLGPEVLATLSVGDQVPVYVLRPEDDKEGILVSLHRARQEQDWIDAQHLLETGGIWEGSVRGFNRGGLIVHYGKIRGFVPASQVTGISRRMDPTTLQNRLSEMVGQDMPLKIIEVDRQNRRLIFSERNARREWRSQQRDKLLDELQEGDHVRGLVSNVCDFGVFVDVGGTDGLVHISELSWRRTGHPSELLKVGDEVEAYVLRVDKERKRIGLSLRLMEPDPWERAEEKYELGQVVVGVVTKITAFGAFAALDDGIEGLIHISELAENPPRHPEEVLSVGTALPLCVVRVEGNRRRMGLSLKRVPEEERLKWEEQTKAEAPSQVATEPDSETVSAPQPTPEERASTSVGPDETQAESTAEAGEAPSGEAVATPEQALTQEAPAPASTDATQAESPEVGDVPSSEAVATPEQAPAQEASALVAPDAAQAETPDQTL